MKLIMVAEKAGELNRVVTNDSLKIGGVPEEAIPHVMFGMVETWVKNGYKITISEDDNAPA